MKSPPTLSEVSFVGVAWNEEARAPKLLRLARRRFEHLVIAVQESTDSTLKIVESFANRPTDRVLKHPHYGAGDYSMPGLMKAVQTDWAFVVSFDEMPNKELLDSLPDALKTAEDLRADAMWIPFRSSIEGVEYEEQHSHLRLFRSHLRWPGKLHSRPAGMTEVHWERGFIRHDRSLDEVARDYLRYYQLGKGDPGWTRHNIAMLHDACTAVAQRVGWKKVTAYEWWPEVRALAFGAEETPWLSETTTSPIHGSSSSRRRP